jgi:hypothetical protein
MVTDSQCRLCQQSDDLRLSHILPAFVFKWLKKDGYIRHAAAIDQRTQDGAKEKWLCSSCESLFNGWETKFANAVFHPFCKDGLPTLSYGDWLLKFCTSVSWRSLLHAQDNAPLLHFNDRQTVLVSQALHTWREFLLGKAQHPGKFEQHLIPFHPVTQDARFSYPPNINRYLLRNVEIDVGCGSSTAFVFSKLGGLAVLGFIELKNPTHWVGTKIRLRGGMIKPRQFVLPLEFGRYLAGRAQNTLDALQNISDTQQQKIGATVLSNLD